MHSKIVLGIDPGIANAGWALLERHPTTYELIECGLISTPSKTQLGKRLKTHFLKIQYLLDTHRPDLVAIEAVYHNRNISSSISTGQVIGIVELASEMQDIPILQIQPQFVKASVVGCNEASKDAVIAAVNRMLRTKVKGSHIADAVACAVAGHLKFPTLTQQNRSAILS